MSMNVLIMWQHLDYSKDLLFIFRRQKYTEKHIREECEIKKKEKY